MRLKDFELCAPKNKFRVVGVDTFALSDDDWIEGDFDSEKEAINIAQNRSGKMLKMHVYDDKGTHIYDAGTF